MLHRGRDRALAGGCGARVVMGLLFLTKRREKNFAQIKKEPYDTEDSRMVPPLQY